MERNDACAGKTLMVVDDDAFIAEDLRAALLGQGAKVVVVHTAAAALEGLAANGGIDAALVDVRLAQGTTAGLVAELRRRAIPTVIITGYGQADLPAGMRGLPYLAKPFRTEDLLEMCRRLFATAIGPDAKAAGSTP